MRTHRPDKYTAGIYTQTSGTECWQEYRQRKKSYSTMPYFRKKKSPRWDRKFSEVSVEGIAYSVRSL